MVVLMAASLDPLQFNFEEYGVTLQLLAWYFEANYATVENHYDVQNLIIIVQKLAIIMETDLKDAEADCLVRCEQNKSSDMRPLLNKNKVSVNCTEDVF